MTKQIAVILSSINLDNQKKILEGLSAAAEDKKVNLYVFTNYIGIREAEESLVGSYSLLKLPDFKKFDGVIMVINTIHYPPIAEYVLNAIKESGVPCVSIDRKYEGMSSVSIHSYDAELEMLEHLIVDHGYRDIHYVSGPIKYNREAQFRLKAYKDALEKYSIPFEESHLYEGGFTLQTGREAAIHFLKDGICPKCIVCGNDAMALGVMEIVQKRGYRVPEDVKVVGFDNGEGSLLSIPPLTTVNKNQFDVGYKALEEVLDVIDGKPFEDHVIPCKLVLRGSCGCSNESVIDVALLRTKYNDLQLMTETMTDVNRNMLSDLASVKNLDSITDILKKYMKLTATSNFYLCMCDRDKVFRLPDKNIGTNIDIMRVNSDYTDEISIPVAYENGEFKSFDKFEKGYVLPIECRESFTGKTYIVTPVFYQKCCYGYVVSSDVGRMVETSLYYSLMMNLAVSLENTRRWMLLEDAVVKLNSLWAYDMLTQLYNRAGFFDKVRYKLEEMKHNNEKAFLIFFDVDGLKKVNDTLGHEAGDVLIQTMADCIRDNLTNKMLAMRYGGDEFVVFGSFDDRKEVEEYVESVRNSISIINEHHMYNFTLSTSIGGSGHWARDIDDLSVLIDQADQEMYKEKKKKRSTIE